MALTREQKKKLYAASANILSRPDKLKAEAIARAKKKNPKLTDAQAEAQWRAVAEQFGL